MSERSTVNALPKLPGFDFSALNQPPTFNKSQSFGFSQGVAVVKSPATEAPAVQRIQDPPFTEGQIKRVFPEWKTLSDKVLRFFGYFTERVDESAVEKMRLRKITIQYFLYDNTVTVVENSVHANSGIRGGTMIKRHANPQVVPSRLQLGEAVTMQNIVFTIVDCDAATKRFYDAMGRPQPGPVDYPTDAFINLQNRPAQVVDADHVDMRRVTEMVAAAATGKQSTKLSPEERARARSFLLHDRDVLNFNATCEGRQFRVNFFLADGTMKVTQLHAPNDGRDPNMAYVKRGIIPKSDFHLKNIDTCSDPRPSPNFTELDLRTGNTINLFGRNFFLYSCDDFTKAYYMRIHEINQGDVERQWAEGDPVKRNIPVEVPPPTGFGTEEDSLGSWKSIVPKAPRKDYAKYIEKASDTLRYACELAKPAPEDECRRFIACYYLADDTVSVYEYAIRNSGHNGGKVFARSKIPGITEKSFFVGAELKLGGYIFKLRSPDERTSNFLERGIPMGGTGSATAEELLARVRHVLTQRFSRVTEAYRHYNTSKAGLGIEDLRRMCHECEVKVKTDETLAEIMNLADLDQDGVISLQEFVENVLRQSLSKKANPATDKAPLTAKSYAELQDSKTKREFADRVLAHFIAKLEARRAFIVDTFRIVADRSVDGLVGVDTFRQVVQDRLGLNLTPDEMDALVFRFYYIPDMPNYLSRRLSLRDFRKIIDA